MTGQLNEISVSFQLSAKDVFAACFGRNLRRFWFLAWTPLAGVLAILIALTDPKFAESANSGYILFAYSAFMFLLIPYLQTRGTMKNPNFQSTITIGVCESFVRVAGKHSSGQMEWKLVKKVTENKRFILIVVQGCFYMIPKAKIGAVELAEFKTAIRAAFPKAKLK